MKYFSLRYSLLTYRLDQLWFPFGFWALFVIVSLFIPEKIDIVARGYLGYAVPLMGGILAAYAILEDPAIELRFTTPVPAWRLLLERLGLILAIQALSAMTFQLFTLVMGGNLLAIFGGWWGLQLAWLVPTLSLMALGTTGALVATQPVGGALLVGVLWLVEVILRSPFAYHKVARYFLVFMRVSYPDIAWLTLNEISVLVWTTLLLVTAWILLQRQERYI